MRYIRYLGYILKHKWYFFQTGLKLKVPIHFLFLHDMSKFFPYEMIQYARTFRSPWGESWYSPTAYFNHALLHHYHHNKHHWQYWVVIKGTSNIHALPMPKRYMKEMLADWYAMGMSVGKTEVTQWYLKQRKYMILHPDTRYWLDEHFGVDY